MSERRGRKPTERVLELRHFCSGEKAHERNSDAPFASGGFCRHDVPCLGSATESVPVIFFTREELGYSAAIVSVFRIFGGADAFCEGAAAQEQDYQQERTDYAPVEDADAGRNSEQVKGAPRALLGKIIGVAADAPETHGIETFVVGCGKVFQFPSDHIV